MKIGFEKLLVLFAVINAISGATEACAATLIISEFEPPYYRIGNLDGRQGWVKFPSGSGSTVVQNTTFASGTQALQIQATGPLGVAATNLRRSIDYPIAELTVRTEVDFLLIGSASAGIENSGDTGFLARIAMSGSNFFVGNSNSQTQLVPYTMGVWYHLTLEINFTTQTAEGFVDGVSIGSLAVNPSSPASRIGDVNLFSHNSLGAPQNVYFDNLLVSAVPEPSSVTLLGLGGIGLVISGFRRRQRAI